MNGKSPDLPAQDQERYNALSEKADSSELTAREAARLHELQAEVDGRDYWVLYSGKRDTEILDEVAPDEFDLRLHRLSDRAASASLSLPAEYEVQRLQFNRRPFLRDFWRELSSEERNCNAQRNLVIELCSEGNHGFEDAHWLLAECDRRLGNVRDLWPFPREDSPEDRMFQ